jgi:predicted nucleic acid-binding protein
MGRRAERSRRQGYVAIILDSEGLSKAAAGHRQVAVTLAASVAAAVPVVVSTITLTEVLRGRRQDAAVHLLLKSFRVVPVSKAIARAAGELLGRAGRKDTVDAVVAATAAGLPGSVRVLTSDPSDLRALTEGMPGIQVEAV